MPGKAHADARCHNCLRCCPTISGPCFATALPGHVKEGLITWTGLDIRSSVVTIAYFDRRLGCPDGV